MATLGFRHYEDQGPGIFLSRLRRELDALGRFDPDAPDVWIQLSFETLPDAIAERRARGLTRVAVRMDGCYCSRWHWVRRPVPLALPLVDDWYSARVNARKNTRIRENLLGADHIVFQSAFSRRLTHRFVCATPPGTVIHNGIDLGQFSPTGERAFSPKAGLNILVSHSFRPYHRLHEAFRILARYRAESGEAAHLHVVGGDDGESLAYALREADRLGLAADGDYTLWGKHPFDRLAAVYRGCDVMLNLSFRDTCPNVVVEALACGLPVVGVNAGGVPELVDDAGVLVDEAIAWAPVDTLDFARLPRAPIPAYAQALARAQANLPALRRQARARAEAALDIRDTAKRYLAVADAMIGAMVATSPF